MKRRKLLVLLIAGIVIITNSCSNGIVDPEPQAGRRDYVWTLDTLNSVFNYFTGLWGSSPNDVWTVGAGGDYDDRLWHFDGTKWSPYSKERILCSGNALYGFAQNDVWMVGMEGSIWHYDGKTWKENYVYKQEDGYANIWDVWGRNASDIYAVGVIHLSSVKEQRGFILHYDGYRWSEYYKANYISQFSSLLGDNDNVFINGCRLVISSDNVFKIDSAYINKIKGKTIKSVYRQVNDGGFSIAIIGEKIHFVIDKVIYKYSDSGLLKVMDINEPKFAGCVYGRSYSDVFIKMYDGVAHYNGTDITYLYKFDNDFSYYSGRLMDFGNTIFFNIPHTKNLRGYLK